MDKTTTATSPAKTLNDDNPNDPDLMPEPADCCSSGGSVSGPEGGHGAGSAGDASSGDEEHAGHGGHGGHHHRRGLAVLLPQSHHHHGGKSGSMSGMAGMEGMKGMADKSGKPMHANPRIVFVGNPNVGKSTLFNAVLGASATVMNAPGTTVLVESGSLERDGERWDFIDTPGTASLDAYSPDEQVAGEAAMGRRSYAKPDIIVFTFNATSPSKSYYLLSQLMDLGFPIIIAVTMLDLAEKQDSPVTLKRLQRTLPGIPMIRVDGRTSYGKAELLDTIAATLTEIKAEAGQKQETKKLDSIADTSRKAIKSADSAAQTTPETAKEAVSEAAHKASEVVETTLEKAENATPPLDGGGADVSREIHVQLTPTPVTSIPAPSTSATQEEVSQWVRATSDERFEWIAKKLKEINKGLPQGAVTTANRETFSDKLDRVLLHPAIGLIVFLITMFLVFEATTTLAGPLQDWFDVTLRGWCTDGIAWIFTAIAGKGSLDGWLYSLIVDGFLNGAITVCTFIPPMGIMFIILSLLEDSGYLARAAFVMDRAMRMVGLDGRAFLPLVVGFGCNLPALASTRTLPDSRQRLLTGLLIPFTSCSARLSVYVVLAYAFFGKYAGLAIFLMYVSSIAIILAVGFALRKTQFKDLKTQPFAMELPPYQMPRLLQLLKSVLQRLWSFITGASSVIVTMLIVVWVLSAIPISAGAAGTNSFGHVDKVENSVFGAVSTSIAPVFKPAGFDDWHASAALVTGFVAKEVVVGSLSQSYAINDSGNQSEQAEGQGSLGQAVHKSFEKSSDGHPNAAAAAFMIFILAYTPCLATVAEMKRQYGMKTALQSVGTGLIVAYILAIIVFQVGRLL
ncbi:ferrous iron transport protein B [Bifidobacterium sp. ESL0690]|uniref:ferrous iron transport protein B n=1 Tax=Bifidobacterium sp. ESL0690 TaxID=2983214 RepID=UPI0023F7D33B|nr:ferrous iron transport protein B [Bifidobacterium sp. ESL0690]WEV46768.1 ferrous iron transport protein B [Bifidobacterium sp. ESL0690]